MDKERDAVHCGSCEQVRDGFSFLRVGILGKENIKDMHFAVFKGKMDLTDKRGKRERKKKDRT